MHWEAVGAIGEIVGAIAVVATLVYLARQMKINTAAVNRSATQAVLTGRGEATRFLASDSEISDLLWKGAENPDGLSEAEWGRFFLIVGAITRPLELAFLDFEDGHMSEELWQGQRNTIEFWFATPGYRRWLEEYGQTLYPRFRQYIDQIGTK